jgi:hypothetical protein
MFLIYLDERAQAARSEAEIEAGMASHTPYIEMLRRNGQYAGSEALAPARSARTLRYSDGKAVATDGPFAESREQLGGFYIVEATDLDQAIRAASQNPALKTVGIAIEIRPMREVIAAGPPPPGRAAHSRYLLAFYRDETDHDEALPASAQLAGLESLAPPGSATTLRLQGGKVALTDGPFAEGGAQLAGCCLVWARDMDDAAGLAAAYPGAGLHAIEVRSVRTTEG